MTCFLINSKRTSLRSCLNSLQRRSLICINFRNVKLFNIHLVVVFCICDCGVQKLLNNRTCCFWSILKNTDCFAH